MIAQGKDIGKPIYRGISNFLGFFGLYVLVLGFAFWSWALCFGTVFAAAMPWHSFCFRLGLCVLV